MSIFVLADIVQEHEKIVVVRLDNGLAGDMVTVAKDKIIERVIGCAYCGHPVPWVETGKTNALMVDHIVKCGKHPMGKMAAAIIFACEALEAAEHDLTVRQGCVMDHEKAEPTLPTESKMYDGETLEKIDLALKACGRRPT